MLYVPMQFTFKAGTNTLTFVLPAEMFPATMAYRQHFRPIVEAAGKKSGPVAYCPSSRPFLSYWSSWYIGVHKI